MKAKRVSHTNDGKVQSKDGNNQGCLRLEHKRDKRSEGMEPMAAAAGRGDGR